MDNLSRSASPKASAPSESGSDGEKEKEAECVKQPEQRIEKHPFSEPWEDSDLVLAVEDETFYVHRQILSLHSPVFKAMLSSQKERTATEIPLAGKKAKEVLDFLKVLYLKETEGITLNKMGHLLKLADEYEVQGVVDLCVKCLKDVPKSEENVVKILYLATDTLKAGEDSRLDSVRRDCEILVKDMDLANITAKGDFKNLNRDSMEKVFVKRTERLESFIKDVHPQLIGLVEYCLHLKLESPFPCVTLCPQHLPPGKSLGSRPAHIGLLQRINSCFGCRDMITQLVSSSYKPVQTITQEDASESLSVQAVPTGVVKEHVYGGGFHFDEKLITLLQDINKIVDLPLPRFGTSTTKTPASSSLGTTAASLPASFSSGTSTISSPASFSLKTSATYAVPTSFNFGTSTTRSPPSMVAVTSATISPALFSSVTSTDSCATSFTFGAPTPSPGFFSSIGSLKEEVGNDQKPRGRKAK